MSPVDALFDDLASRCSPDSVIRRAEPLAKRTTLRVGGAADIYFEPAGEQDLALAVRMAVNHSMPWMILGRGSNLLIRDGGIRGLVVCLGREGFSRMRADGAKIEAGAGVRLKHLAVETKRLGIAGLEFLEGIPGSVGGALRMNAGAMGAATLDRVVSVRAMNRVGEIVERSRESLEVHYRHCPFFDAHVALSAVFVGELQTREAIEERMKRMSSKRWESQPAAPSAGCIFKNPGTIPAGKLIDELGLKGAVEGGARVSEIHGNFIVNDGEATAGDVLRLIERVRATALASRGIRLETEVQIVGEDLKP